MTQLVEALDALHLEGELSHADRWVKLQGQRCRVYVATAKDGGYFTWCDDPQERMTNVATTALPLPTIGALPPEP